MTSVFTPRQRFEKERASSWNGISATTGPGDVETRNHPLGSDELVLTLSFFSGTFGLSSTLLACIGYMVSQLLWEPVIQ